MEGVEIKKLTVHHRIKCTNAVYLKREILWDPKQKKGCVEEREDRVMPQKIRSDRLIVNWRKKKVLKRKVNVKSTLEILSDEKEKRRLFLRV